MKNKNKLTIRQCISIPFFFIAMCAVGLFTLVSGVACIIKEVEE